MNIASEFCRFTVSLVTLGVLTAGVSVSRADVGGLQSLESVRKAAEDYVREAVPEGSYKTFITASALDNRLRLAQCLSPLRAGMMSGAQIQARTSIGVSCRDGVSWTVYVPVTVESEISVLVLRNASARDARLTEQDVAIQTRRVSGTGTSYITDIELVNGRVLKRSAPAGTALTADILIPDFKVRRGDQVTLLAAVGGIEVRAPGKALTDGREGARISVQNLNSLKVVQGRVDESGVIRVSP